MAKKCKKKKLNLLSVLFLLILLPNFILAITDANLVAWYKLDETTGTVVWDAKGGDNNATNSGSVPINQTGKIGTAYGNWGDPKYLDFNIIALNSNYNRPFSVCAWAKQDNNRADAKVIFVGAGGTDNFQYSLEVSSAEKFKFAVCKRGTACYEAVSNGDLTNGLWYHVCGTYVGGSDTNGIKVYVNGVLQNTKGTYLAGAVSPANYKGSLGNNQEATNQYWDGKLDEVSYWDINLSQTQINELYNSGTGTTYPFAPPYGVDANFIYTINPTLSLIDLYDASTDTNVTISDWNWLIDGIKQSDDQNYFFQGIQNQDYNICLQAGGIAPDTNFYSDTYCQTVNIDTIAPTIDGNLVFTPGFVTGFDVNYNLTCYDTSLTNINYQVIRNDTNYLYNSNDSNATTKTGSFSFTPPSTATITMNCIDTGGNTATLTFDTIYGLTFRLINEETGALLTTSDFNGASRMFIKKVVAFDEDGNFSYDFNSTSTVQKNFLGYSNNLWFEITYNNAGTDTMIDRKIDFGLIPDTNIGVCIPTLQTFYQQDFYSIGEKEGYLYQPNAKCYVMAGTTYYLVAEGKQITTWTINLPYKLYTINNGLTTFLAYINGAIENRYNLDAIAFNQQAVTIAIGQDTLAFTPGVADSNTVNIYFKSFNQDYVSTTLTIYNGDTQLFTLTEDTNANEFDLIWLYSSYGITDQNILKIVVEGTNSSGEVTILTEYFNILGDEYLGNKDPSFIAVIVILFFLFGITMMSVGKTFGWFGIVVCVTSMAVSLMSVQTYWLLMIEGGLFICFLFILFSGGLVQTFGGMR